MNELRKERALELVKHLERAGMNCGLLAVQGTVVLRCAGAPYTDTPVMMFDETDLRNGVALGLLERQKVTGIYKWEWYRSKKATAK